MSTRRGPLGLLRLVIVAGALLIADGPATLAQSAPPDETIFPQTVPRVWYRTGTDRGLAGPKHTGDLMITPDSLEFFSDKLDISIPVDRVSMITLGTMSGDVNTEWVVLTVERDGGRELVGLRDGRKLGYGQKTKELFETLLAAANRFSWAQFGAPDGLEPYTELDHVFALAVPRGWSSYHHELVSVDGVVTWGTVVFTPRPMISVSGAPSEQDADERTRALEAIQKGEVTAWIVVRHASGGGMGCDGFSSRAVRALRSWIARDPFFGRPFDIEEQADFGPESIDSCRGLKLVVRGKGAGDAIPVLDLRVVSHGSATVLLGLRTTAAEYDTERRRFDQGVATLRLAVTR